MSSLDETEFAEKIVHAWRNYSFSALVHGKEVDQVDFHEVKNTLDVKKTEEIRSYQKDVNAIIHLFTKGKFKGKTYNIIEEIVDTFGPRMTGSKALEDSIDWVLREATSQGFDKIYTEPVKVPHWERNCESLIMTIPRTQQLALLGLGTSIGTPPEGITAEIIVVESYQELKIKANQVDGKIVVYNVPFTTYGNSVQYRLSGAVEAAKYGAVACLVRSVTDFSIASPHAGVQTYEESVTKIPSAAITVASANMLHRMHKKGTCIVLKLKMGAKNLPPFQSRNTILEVQGSDSADEIVLVSGHLDSWDIGTGAMDDAGGCAISWLAGLAVKELNFSPRRTIRTVMFTGEEQGIHGGEAYFKAHCIERKLFQIMMESDFGIFEPEGMKMTGNEEAINIMREILSLTSELGTSKENKLVDQIFLQVSSPADTPDLAPFDLVGVPRGSLRSDTSRYLWYHHTHGDTLDVYENPDILDKVAALWASVTYVMASVNFRLHHQQTIKL